MFSKTRRFKEFVVFSSVICLQFSLFFSSVLAETTQTLAEDQEKDISVYNVQAQLSPLFHTVLSSEIGGKIKRLGYREGDSFKVGDTLVSLDCSIYNAHLQKAQAEADIAEKVYAISQRLDQLNGNSLLELEQTAANRSIAKAELLLMQTNVSHCTIKAPFKGRIVTWLAEPHQYVSSGTPLLEIVDPINLEIRLIVPSQWLIWLDEQTEFNFLVEEIGVTYAARVTQIGSVVDPVSQSIPVAAQITSGPQQKLLPGMSGRASFKGAP